MANYVFANTPSEQNDLGEHEYQSHPIVSYWKQSETPPTHASSVSPAPTVKNQSATTADRDYLYVKGASKIWCHVTNIHSANTILLELQGLMSITTGNWDEVRNVANDEWSSIFNELEGGGNNYCRGTGQGNSYDIGPDASGTFMTTVPYDWIRLVMLPKAAGTGKSAQIRYMIRLQL